MALPNWYKFQATHGFFNLPVDLTGRRSGRHRLVYDLQKSRLYLVTDDFTMDNSAHLSWTVDSLGSLLEYDDTRTFKKGDLPTLLIRPRAQDAVNQAEFEIIEAKDNGRSVFRMEREFLLGVCMI